MPKWICYALYFVIVVLATIAQNVKDADISKACYTMAIGLLAAEITFSEVL